MKIVLATLRLPLGPSTALRAGKLGVAQGKQAPFLPVA
jgi:hypothetical protein